MGFLPFLFLSLLLNFHVNVAMKTELLSDISSTPTSKLQTYIVFVTEPREGFLGGSTHLETWYKSFLSAVTRIISSERPQLLYSYKHVICGFSARLTEQHLKIMEGIPGFISAVPDTILHLHTTHTPGFLGLNQQSGFWKDHSNFGKGVIIRLLDTGVTPGHPSFNDQGMPPPPPKWKGGCESDPSKCNNKLIGIKTFNLANPLLLSGLRSSLTADDDEGHGTHTAGTAAGAFVKGANAFSNAEGTATGMAPLAHIAMYKVCSEQGCSSVDILAALDAAINDGVDVLSLSLGGSSVPFFLDYIAVGTYAAIQKGIFVSCSAGNSGPSKSTVSNEAPWILTVGASTIDRRIVTVAKLGNGEEYAGESLYQPHDYTSPSLRLKYAGDSNNKTTAFCGDVGLLINIDVKGKVVVCDMGGGIGRFAKGSAVKSAGGAAMILVNGQLNGFTTLAEAHVLPVTHTSFEAGLKIKSYINSTPNPTASILFKGTIIENPSSDPAMAYFSSRGPSLATPGILKPDITGPGVNILAAWPFPLDNNTNTKSTFNVISGTSMSCPHLSGIAALIKSSHPDWSPAAIKSAIMTTADITNRKGNPIVDETMQRANLFAIGPGHVNPSAAANPGLVYDLQPNDYLPYLCGLYGSIEVSIIVRKVVVCELTSKIPEGELNYPSFTVKLGSRQTFSRTVTNVGDTNSIYKAIIEAPKGVSVTVQPSQLRFTKVNQKVRCTVRFSRVGAMKGFGEGYLKWVSDKHVVRSPISVNLI